MSNTYSHLESPNRNIQSHRPTNFPEEPIIPTFVPPNSAPACTVHHSDSRWHGHDFRTTAGPEHHNNSENEVPDWVHPVDSDILNTFESGVFKLSECCNNQCVKGRRRVGRVSSTEDAQDALLHRSQLESSTSLDSDGFRLFNDDPEGRQHWRNEVENWMKRRLIYFFMSPLEKFRAKRRLPCKLFSQLLKVIVITIQLILFGISRSAHVSFGDDSRIAFCHLYLLDWDVQYETLQYPPAAGPYAFYEKSEFFEAVGYALTQFNRTREIAIGSYQFSSKKPHVTLCQSSVSNTPDAEGSTISQLESEYCIKVTPLEIPLEALSDAKHVEDFLDSRNFTVHFTHLLNFQLRFALLSPVITQLDWIHDPECFRFQIRINMEKHQQSGMLNVYLVAPYSATLCNDVVHPNKTQTANGTENLQLLWELWSNRSSFNPSVFQYNLSWRRVSIVLLHCSALLLGAVSFVLCARSIGRGFVLWKETVMFFQNWYSITLWGYFWRFVQPWFVLIMANDIVIISSSTYALLTLESLHHKPEPISYVFGVSALLVWFAVLRYVSFSYTDSILMRTISNSIPALLRFGVCSLILFFAFSLCGWVVLGPYNLKFRTFIGTLECLFSLINGDDMFVTFSIIDDRSPQSIYIFSRLFLYVFITLFIYVVLNLFITIVFEAYEEVKYRRVTRVGTRNSPLFRFVGNHSYDCRSPVFRQDDCRPDRHLLHWCALGRWPADICFRDSMDLNRSDTSISTFQKVKARIFCPRQATIQRCSPPAEFPVGETICSSSVSFVSEGSSSSRNINTDMLPVLDVHPEDQDSCEFPTESFTLTPQSQAPSPPPASSLCDS